MVTRRFVFRSFHIFCSQNRFSLLCCSAKRRRPGVSFSLCLWSARCCSLVALQRTVHLLKAGRQAGCLLSPIRLCTAGPFPLLEYLPRSLVSPRPGLTFSFHTSAHRRPALGAGGRAQLPPPVLYPGHDLPSGGGTEGSDSTARWERPRPGTADPAFEVQLITFNSLIAGRWNDFSTPGIPASSLPCGLPSITAL